MITPDTFLEQTHCMTFIKSGGSNARKKCGLCQKLSRGLNHTTAALKVSSAKTVQPTIKNYFESS